jgi:hypothetical protein
MRPALFAAFCVGLLVFLAGPASADVHLSFFDVFTELSLQSQAPAVTYGATGYGFPVATDTIIQRLADSVTPSTTSPGSYQVTSFFDVFTDITGPSGSTIPLHGEAKLDYTTPWDPTQPLPSGSSSFQATMGEFDLDNAGVGVAIHVTQVPPGTVAVTDTGGGNFRINSFFDIFTELSLDGGTTWTPASGPLSLSGSSVPEPTTLIVWSLLGGCGIAVVSWRRKRTAA